MVFGIFFIQFIAHLLLTAFFVFDWNKKGFIKIINTKGWEDKHAFVDKIFNYELREAFAQRCSVKRVSGLQLY